MAETLESGNDPILESFHHAAGSYEHRMGTVTRAIAQHLVSSLEPVSPPPWIYDSACGTGAVTDAILAKVPHTNVIATDISPKMVEHMRIKINENHWQNRVQVFHMDSAHLDFSDDIFDLTIMNLGIFFIPEERKAAGEVFRTLKQGGTAVLTCWKESPLGPLLEDVQDIIHPQNITEGLSKFHRWADPQTLYDILSRAQFSDITLQECPVLLNAGTLGELAELLSENLKVIVSHEWTSDEKQKLLQATETVLASERKKYLTVDTDLEKAVTFIPWVATARKLQN